MSTRAPLLAPLAAVLLLAARLALADPHPMTGGESPAPTGDAAVAIAHEVLSIDIDLKKANVRAVVTLENRGPATKLVVGFPCDATTEPGVTGLPCKTKILVRGGGKAIAPKLKPTSKAEKHWVWPMAFEAGEKIELEVRYAAPLLNDRYGVPLMGLGLFYYRLSTGARWAGSIGEIEITVNVPAPTPGAVAKALIGSAIVLERLAERGKR